MKKMLLVAAIATMLLLPLSGCGIIPGTSSSPETESSIEKVKQDAEKLHQDAESVCQDAVDLFNDAAEVGTQAFESLPNKEALKEEYNKALNEINRLYTEAINNIKSSDMDPASVQEQIDSLMASWNDDTERLNATYEQLESVISG